MAGPIGDNQEHTLREAVKQFIDAQLQGRDPDIDEFVKQYPEIEPRIRQKIRSLQKIDALFDSVVQADETDFEDTATGHDLVGQKIGDFEIREMIGRGGMGVVYLARDTKLDRSVAIKSMPPELLSDPTAQTRFRREAKLLASLNHPNIAVIHEIIEQEEAARYLVLEYVPGDTLAKRIARKAPAVQEALSISLQIAQAVSAAHNKGVIHRDLKPGNIKLTPDGRVKVLDFGLAKPAGGEAAGQDITVTQTGSVIGTPAYMSPEQLRSDPTDHRTDIWSFGCVLFEMLTGGRPFEGKTISDTVAHILEREPDWQALPEETPANIRVLLRRCLEKNPQRRLQHMGDASIEIDETLTELRLLKKQRQSGTSTAEISVARPRRRTLLKFAFAGLGATILLLVFSYLALRFARKAGEPRPLLINATFIKLTNEPGPELFPSLSPTGRTVVYASQESGNWDIYSLRVGGENPINMTKDFPDGDTQPAFSPDGQSIAFRSERDSGGIFLMGATGESPRRLTNFGYNPVWSPNGREIVFATEGIDASSSRRTTSQLWVVNVGTGQTRQIAEVYGVQPHWSPHGHRIAYWTLAEGGQRDIVTIPFEGGEPVHVTNDPATDWNPIWSPDGDYLHFCSDRGGSMNLWRVRIDEPMGEVLGRLEPVTAGVSADCQHLSLSGDGRRIAYVSKVVIGNIQRVAFDPSTGSVEGEPVWITRGSGRVGEPNPSPDGQWLTYSSGGKQEDIFVIKTNGTSRRQLTDDLYKDRRPQWSPDGRRIVFMSDRSGSYEAWTINPDGSQLKRRTTTPAGDLWYPIWSPDGSQLAYSQGRGETGVGAFILDLGKAWEEQTPMGLPALADAEELFIVRSWSANGKHLAGEVMDMDTGVWSGITTYSLDSKRFQKLTDFGHMSVWLSDNRRLLFVYEDKLFLLDGETKHYRELLSIKPDAFSRDLGVQADDLWIYFTRETAEADIWLIDLE